MPDLEKHAIFLCGFITGTYDIKGGETIPKTIQAHIDAIMGVGSQELVKAITEPVMWQPEPIENVIDRVKLVKRDFNLDDITDPTWPEEKVNRLIEMKENGESVDNIAKELGKTYNQVTSKWSHMNRKKKHG
jgi:hypothetical protein